jgi:hypothetical protein
MRKAPPICFEKGVDILPIFRKLIKESSRVVIAMEAETEEEAEKGFEDYLRNPEVIKHIKQLLDMNREQSIESLHTFPNHESYNRAHIYTTDIDITKKEEKDG